MAIGDLFSGGMLTSSVLLKLKVDTSDAKRGLKELTGEEKKAAQAAIDLQNKKNAQLESWAKGIAKVTGGLMLAQKGISLLGDAWKAYEASAKKAGGAEAQRAAEFRKSIDQFGKGLDQFKAGLGSIVVAFGPVLAALGRALSLLGDIGSAIGGGSGGLEQRIREARNGRWDNQGQWAQENAQRAPLEGPQWGDWRKAETMEDRQKLLEIEATALATQHLRQFSNLKGFHSTQIGIGANMAKLDKLNAAIEASMGDFGDEITEKLARTAYHQINSMVPGGIGSMQDFLSRFSLKKKSKGGGGGFTLDNTGGLSQNAIAYTDLTEYGKEQQFQQRMADMQRRQETQRWADSIQPGGDQRIAGMLSESKSNLALSGALDFDPEQFMAKLQGDRKKTIFESIFGPPEDFDLYTTKLELMSGALDIVGGALQTNFDAWVDGSLSAGQAFKKFGIDVISGMSKMLMATAIQEGVAAIVSLARKDVPGALLHAKAAGMAAAGAVAVGGLARAIGGGGGSGGGGGGAPSVTGGGGGGGATTITNTYLIGDGFSEDSPRRRQQRSERTVRMGKRALSDSTGVADG